jgi:NADH:ubiquinone oxidoreductase subunit 6 (subunit J)
MGLIITVIIFILTIIILIVIKPTFLYDKKKRKFKQFGYGKHKTILTLPILSIFVSIIVFIVSYIIRDETQESNTIITQSPNKLINDLPNNLLTGGFDLKSLIEAGIKAKLAEQINI